MTRSSRSVGGIVPLRKHEENRDISALDRIAAHQLFQSLFQYPEIAEQHARLNATSARRA